MNFFNVKQLLDYIFSHEYVFKTVKKYFINNADKLGIDFLDIGYRKNGILNYHDFDISGENFVISYWLKDFFLKFSGQKKNIFDIGANAGDYSYKLLRNFNNDYIFSFEPNNKSYLKLQDRFQDAINLQLFNLALSSKNEKSFLYFKKDGTLDEHSSMVKSVFTDIHNYGYKDIGSIEVESITLDSFCFKKNIDIIHFIKIDTEGNELEILKGAKELLKDGKIQSIQFEFNEMNIASRVYLKDFFDLLPNFNFYRLLPNGLLELKYHPKHEIFLFQNILAVKKDLN